MLVNRPIRRDPRPLEAQVLRPSSEHDLYITLFLTNGGGW
jgi:hypothetical protein